MNTSGIGTSRLSGVAGGKVARAGAVTDAMCLVQRGLADASWFPSSANHLQRDAVQADLSGIPLGD